MRRLFCFLFCFSFIIVIPEGTWKEVNQEGNNLSRCSTINSLYLNFVQKSILFVFVKLMISKFEVKLYI